MNVYQAGDLDEEFDQLIEEYIEVEQDVGSVSEDLQARLQPARNRLHRARDRAVLSFQKLLRQKQPPGARGVRLAARDQRIELGESIREFQRAVYALRVGLHAE